MQRRALLVSSTSLLVGLAGCQSTADRSDSGRSTPSTSSSTQTPSETETATKTPEPALVGDPPGDSRFSDESCPEPVGHCYHETTDETAVYVRPSAERVEMGGKIVFSLVNRTAKPLFIGPYYWDVWRESEDGWVSADSRDYVEDLGARIESGGEYLWTVPIDTNGDRTMSSDRAAVGIAFETGRYCFGIRNVGTEDQSETYGTVGALFEVV